MHENGPFVGTAVIILKDNKVLMGKRMEIAGDGEYALPGGHLEYGETIEECVIREVLEETGMEIKNIRFQFVCAINKYGNKHYVVIVMASDWQSGEPQNLEPDINESWEWYSLDNLPQPLFYSAGLAIESLKTGKNYFDLQKL